MSCNPDCCVCLTFSDYPHKYGPEGGCADSSVFERMKRYQASGTEEKPKVNRVASGH